MFGSPWRSATWGAQKVASRAAQNAGDTTDHKGAGRIWLKRSSLHSSPEADGAHAARMEHGPGPEVYCQGAHVCEFRRCCVSRWNSCHVPMRRAYPEAENRHLVSRRVASENQKHAVIGVLDRRTHATAFASRARRILVRCVNIPQHLRLGPKLGFAQYGSGVRQHHVPGEQGLIQRLWRADRQTFFRRLFPECA